MSTWQTEGREVSAITLRRLAVGLLWQRDLGSPRFVTQPAKSSVFQSHLLPCI